jgi:hypothetical protein
MLDISGNNTLVSLYVEYRLAHAAREMAYDEMLTRRGDYIELYGLDMEAEGSSDLLDTIDNTDWEFWQFHNNVNQRYANAAEAFGRAVAMSEQDVLRAFGGQGADLVQIDWDAHENDGLHQPERYTSKEQEMDTQDKLTDHTYALLLCQQGMNETIELHCNDGSVRAPIALKEELLKNINGVRQLLNEFESTVNGLG